MNVLHFHWGGGSLVYNRQRPDVGDQIEMGVGLLVDVVHGYGDTSSGSARQRSWAVTSRRGSATALRIRPF